MKEKKKVSALLGEAYSLLRGVSKCMAISVDDGVIVMSKDVGMSVGHTALALCASSAHIRDAAGLLERETWNDRTLNSILLNLREAVSYIEIIENNLKPPLPGKAKKNLEKAKTLLTEALHLLEPTKNK